MADGIAVYSNYCKKYNYYYLYILLAVLGHNTIGPRNEIEEGVGAGAIFFGIYLVIERAFF